MKNIRVYVAAAVTVMFTGGALITSASAEAATLGSPARTAVATAVVRPADTSAQAGNNSCTADYTVSTNTVAGWTKAEWNTNPCNYLLQVRAWCNGLFGSESYWTYSGKVKAVDLWDQASCGVLSDIGGTYIHFSYDGGSTWTTWQQYIA